MKQYQPLFAVVFVVWYMYLAILGQNLNVSQLAEILYDKLLIFFFFCISEFWYFNFPVNEFAGLELQQLID